MYNKNVVQRISFSAVNELWRYSQTAVTKNKCIDNMQPLVKSDHMTATEWQLENGAR